VYRPNFCAECGVQILRERWHFWTSRSFCADCSTSFRRERILLPLMACAALFVGGLLAGRAMRQAAPPLLVERAALPLAPAPSSQVKSEAPAPERAPGAGGQQDAATLTEREGGAEDAVYICGARTQKGTPCSRRVRGTGRCWQHLGMPAMIPLEKRLVARR
jgi:hypothetical protein